MTSMFDSSPMDLTTKIAARKYQGDKYSSTWSVPAYHAQCQSEPSQWPSGVVGCPRSPEARPAHVLTPPSESELAAARQDWGPDAGLLVPVGQACQADQSDKSGSPSADFTISSILLGSGPTQPALLETAPKPLRAPLGLGDGATIAFDPKVSKEFMEFRALMLESVRQSQESTNAKMRRSSGSCSQASLAGSDDPDKKDPAYLARRSKNNQAAKRSRDLRRAKEYETTIKAAFFERAYLREKNQNNVLRMQLANLELLLVKVKAKH